MALIEMPDDLTVDILSRLPVKCLLRLKAVCKSWRDIIENPQFIAKHHQTRAAITNGCLLFKHLNTYWPDEGEGDREVEDDRFSFIYGQSPSFKLEECSLFFIKEKMHIRTVAPCNGIFCMLLGMDTIVLWNPATREVKTLPRCDLRERLSPPPDFDWAYNYRILGLSFDSKSNAYKLVRIWVLRRNHFGSWLPHNEMFRNIVEVWSPNNKYWRQINEVPPVPVACEDDQLNLKGRCYWRAGWTESQLVSFDMVKEVFRGIPLPDDNSITLTEKATGWFQTAILNEAIAFINQPFQSNETLFEVWLLKDGLGDDVSWSKHVTLHMPIPRPWHWGFFNNGAVFVFSDTYLKFLDRNTGQVTDTEVRICYSQQTYVYHESLVSLKALGLV